MHLVRKSMPWDVRKAFAAVTQIAVVPQSLVINPKVPAKTVKEFIALAKREPDKLSYGSAGPGTGPHMAMELFKLMAGIQIQHIPYRGVSQSVTDILGGSISGMMLNVLTAKPHVEAGQAADARRHQRSSAPARCRRSRPSPRPASPTTRRCNGSGCWRRAARRRRSSTKLQTLIAEGMRTPEMQERLKTEGADAVVNTPEVVPEADQRRDRALDQAREGDQPEAGV